MKIPLSIAKQLILLQQGHKIASTKLKHPTIQKMLEDGMLQKQRLGANKYVLTLPSTHALSTYLHNQFGITNLEEYIQLHHAETLTKATLVQVAGNSKHTSVKSFQGFLINTYTPIHAQLQGHRFDIHPMAGAYHFIHHYASFHLPKEVTVVGIENAENFRCIQQQAYLFQNIVPLFISRYPQEQQYDIIHWLKSIPNNYLHFGDFDLAGIQIYLSSYKKHLQDRAQFFVPANMEQLLQSKGNREIYNQQLAHIHLKPSSTDEPALQQLIYWIHLYKKGLEQEYFIHP